jgi:uncharacterized protein YdiU (UPF0061 family)
MNFGSFAKALLPLMGHGEERREAESLVDGFADELERARRKAFGKKLGFQPWQKAEGAEGLHAGSKGWSMAKLLEDCLRLMQVTAPDYAIFWRQLARVPRLAVAAMRAAPTDKSGVSARHLSDLSRLFASPTVARPLIEPLKQSFYADPVSPAVLDKWVAWVLKWLSLLLFGNDAAPQGTAQLDRRVVEAEELMRENSPKFIPREWMLIEAYEKAEQLDFSGVRALQKLFSSPYEEQTEAANREYYRKTPPKWRNRARASFMT